MQERKAGILMPVSGLPSKYGVGDFGYDTYEFIDLIKKAGFKIWQILPLNPLGYGYSPYQPYSSKAMDEIYISLELLYCQKILLERPKNLNKNKVRIDYEAVRKHKEYYLKKAFMNFKKDRYFLDFGKNEWVFRYALFLTLKKNNNMMAWNKWSKDDRDILYNDDLLNSFKLQYQTDIDYEIFVQYILHKQWYQVKNYANQKGILIMGDLPFYVGIDSDDVWLNRDMFLLDRENNAKFIAGVPPDYFSATGQRWGNPIYNWDNLEKTDFNFWLDRLAFNNQLFDIIRIDHFRAFDTYWSIDAKCPTAIDGAWLQAPGYQLFDQLFNKVKDINIVVEDLGDLRPEVLSLRDHYNFKGMNILQFTFDLNSDNKGQKNSIIYTGTHDNQTIRSWFMNQSNNKKQQILRYLKNNGYQYDKVSQNLVALVFNSNCLYAIIPIQDLLDMTDYKRINTPGTLGSPNWEFKLKDFKQFSQNIKLIKKMIKNSKR